MAIEGPLKELSLEDVFQLLDLTRKSGVLELRSERWNDEAAIYFDGGRVVMAARRKMPRRLGRQLLRAGIVSERELVEAVEYQRQTRPRRRIGEILVERGVLTAEELERQLRFLIAETIFELMEWTEGHFRFEEGDVPGFGAVDVRVTVESLLIEGARRMDEWARLCERVRSLDAVPAFAKVGEEAVLPVELSPDQWEILAEVDGRRDIRTIAADLGRATFDVARALYDLIGAGIIEVHETVVRSEDREIMASVARVEGLLRAGDIETAARLAREMAATHPDRAELAILSGRSLARLGRMRAAMAAFSRAVALDPLSADAHFHLGCAAVRTGDLERAAEAWETYLGLAGDDARSRVAARALDAVRALNRVLTPEFESFS